MARVLKLMPSDWFLNQNLQQQEKVHSNAQNIFTYKSYPIIMLLNYCCVIYENLIVPNFIFPFSP